jgi:hypothetical protein
MNQLIFSFFALVAPIAIVAYIIGTARGQLFRNIDKKIDSKLQKKQRR